MKRRGTTLAVLCTLAVGGCVSIPQEDGITASEWDIACSVTHGLSFGARTDVEWTPDGEGSAPLRALSDSLAWKSLPQSAQCPDGRRRFHSSGYGDFLTDFGLSADGSVAAVRGGYQYFELHGGGGECYFERAGSSWRRIGCLHTWDS